MGSLRNYHPPRGNISGMGSPRRIASERGTRGISFRNLRIADKKRREEDRPPSGRTCTLPCYVYTARHENEFPLTGFSAINQLNRVRVRRAEAWLMKHPRGERDASMIGSFDGGPSFSPAPLPSFYRVLAEAPR